MKAVFLDRDGVINPLVVYPEMSVPESPFSADKFRLFPGVPEAICRLNKKGIKVIVVSNQPAIAKGKMTLKNLEGIDGKLEKILKAKNAYLDEIVYCYHHPSEGKSPYKKKCKCGKPKPGMLLMAAKKHSIDLKGSYMVGDNLTDIQAGADAGTKTVLIGRMKCELCRRMDEVGVKPDHIEADLKSAVKTILNEMENEK